MNVFSGFCVADTLKNMLQVEYTNNAAVLYVGIYFRFKVLPLISYQIAYDPAMGRYQYKLQNILY